MPIPALDTTGNKFEYWWNINGECVEPPNQRRGGESCVLRVQANEGKTLYIKRQKNHLYRDIFHPFGQATIIREFNAYSALHKAQIKIPQLVYCGVMDEKAILVTEALEGFTDLDSWINEHRGEANFQQTIHLLLQAIAALLAKFHLNHFQHGSLYGKHLFVKAIDHDGQIKIDAALLDLEKVKKRLTAKEAALHDMPKIKRHSLLNQEEWRYLIQEYEQAFGAKLSKLY